MLVPVKRSTPEGGLEPEDRKRIRRLAALLQRAPGPRPDIRPSLDAHLVLWDTCFTDGKLPAAVEMGGRGGSAKTDKPKGLAKLSPEHRQEIREKALITRAKPEAGARK